MSDQDAINRGMAAVRRLARSSAEHAATTDDTTRTNHAQAIQEIVNDRLHATNRPPGHDRRGPVWRVEDDAVDAIIAHVDALAAERDALQSRIVLARTKLRAIADRQVGGRSDNEQDHIEADGILLDVIDDDEITSAFDSLGNWYA